VCQQLSQSKFYYATYISESFTGAVTKILQQFGKLSKTSLRWYNRERVAMVEIISGLTGDAENARHELAGHENAAPCCRGGKCET